MAHNATDQYNRLTYTIPAQFVGGSYSSFAGWSASFRRGSDVVIQQTGRRSFLQLWRFIKLS